LNFRRAFDPKFTDKVGLSDAIDRSMRILDMRVEETSLEK
jgi:hypothetical protein